LIVCIITNNKPDRPSQANISVFAPFLVVGPNVLCLFYDGQTFYILSSKGYITKFYKPPTSRDNFATLDTLNMNELFRNTDMYEHGKIPDGFIPIRDDGQEIVALHFKQFINLTNLHEVIRLADEEWRTLIQYAKIRDRLDEMRKFVARMKNAATPIGDRAKVHQTREYWSTLENIINELARSSYLIDDFVFTSSRAN